MSQFALPLAWPADERDAEFVVSPASEDAVTMLGRWAHWPVRTGLLVGPPRSGRSLLARVFAATTRGRVIDDADRANEAELFHAWNRAEGDGVPQLFVATAPPPVWHAALPDLRTRLAASPVAIIGAPDDAIIAALIERGFERRHLPAAPELVAWLTRRVERRHEAVLEAVERLAGAAMTQRRRLSIPLARETLGSQFAFNDENSEIQ